MSTGCGRARHQSPTNCDIRAEVKNRNGQPRWWCSVHGAPAWAADGSPLVRCAGYRDVPVEEITLTLDPGLYPGGVAAWGAVDPVINTGPRLKEFGVHVHARRQPGGHKQIDDTYDRVAVQIADGSVREIDSAAAVAFMASNVCGVALKVLRCPHCGAVHLDAGEFAVMPHRKHQCNTCGRSFFDPDGEPSVSNPLARLGESLGHSTQPPIVSRQALSISTSDFPGGIAVWGSNPAVLWTAGRSEEAGIHVHAWGDGDRLVVDDTFGSVIIDGRRLDVTQVRTLMVQQSLDHLRGRVVSLDCPNCGCPHFDVDAEAVRPHEEHQCQACGSTFRGRSRYRGLVSNPLVNVLRQLQ